MKRPYIICHMATSIDGKILFGNWSENIPKTQYSELYNKCHEMLDGQGWILGRVSLEQDFSRGLKSNLVSPGSPISRVPFISDKNATSFAVTMDTRGTLGWETNEIGGDHIIAVLKSEVSDEYLYYLQQKQISYVFIEDHETALQNVLIQLTELFPIEKLMLEGGGKLNGAFLHEGIIDEVSILLLPIVDGTSGTTSVFEISTELPVRDTEQLQFLSAEPLEEGVLWLRYQVEQKTENQR